MSVGILDPAAMLDRVLDYATKNLRVEKLLIQVGLDPSNITYEAIFNRLLDIALANITFANVLFLAGGIFLIATFVVRTMVPLRVLCIISGVFFLASAALAGSVPQFFLYLLALPINFIRLFQIRNLVKKARSSAQGDLSLDWLRPFMTPRNYQKGDVLFRKGDAATEMFLTVTGKFLVTEIGIEIPAGRILGELGFVSPNNHRTQSVECIEDGEVLAVGYDRLLEIYLQNPEFGYYFLRLTSDRLLQNFARLQGLVEQSKAALAAANAAKTATLPDSNQAGRAEVSEAKPAKAAVPAINKVRAIAAGAIQQPKASAPTRSASFADNVIEMVPKWKARLAAIARTSPSAESVEIEASRRRKRATAIVERHANYSAIGGFIPLPIANVAAITAVIMRMVRELNKLYGEPIEHDRAYAIAIGLMGGVMPTGLAKLATSTIASLRARLQPGRACGLFRDRVGLCPQRWLDAHRPFRRIGGVGAGSIHVEGDAALAKYLAHSFGQKRRSMATQLVKALSWRIAGPPGVFRFAARSGGLLFLALFFGPQTAQRRPVRQCKGRWPGPHRDAARHSLRPEPHAPRAGPLRSAQQRGGHACRASQAAEASQPLLGPGGGACARLIQAAGVKAKHGVGRGHQFPGFRSRRRSGGENKHQSG